MDYSMCLLLTNQISKIMNEYDVFPEGCNNFLDWRDFDCQKVIDEFKEHGFTVTADAISFLNDCAGKKWGWELLGMLKEAIEYNRIDIDKKAASWQK